MAQPRSLQDSNLPTDGGVQACMPTVYLSEIQLRPRVSERLRKLYDEGLTETHRHAVQYLNLMGQL